MPPASSGATYSCRAPDLPAPSDLRSAHLHSPHAPTCRPQLTTTARPYCPCAPGSPLPHTTRVAHTMHTHDVAIPKPNAHDCHKVMDRCTDAHAAAKHWLLDTGTHAPHADAVCTTLCRTVLCQLPQRLQTRPLHICILHTRRHHAHYRRQQPGRTAHALLVWLCHTQHEWHTHHAHPRRGEPQAACAR